MKLECKYFESQACGSCPGLKEQSDWASSKQKAFQKRVEDQLGFKGPIQRIFESSRIFPSRTKAKFSVSGDPDRPKIGLIDSHFKGVELLNCPLHLGIINQIAEFLVSIIAHYKLTPYDIAARKGELKGIIVKSAFDESQVILRFVLRSTEAVPRIRKAVVDIQKAFSQVRVVSANIQPVPHAILEGREEIVLTKQHTIQEKYGENTFVFSPQSFSQVTFESAFALYRYVGSKVQQIKPEGMWDLFCGVGGFSYFSAPFSRWSLGVELSSAAITSAKEGATINKKPACDFIAEDVETFLKRHHAKLPELVLVNPPKRGLEPSMIQLLKQQKPKTILYSSCNPNTLIRDLESLKQVYALEDFALFDMFPLTEHLETVAHLKLRLSTTK